MDLADTIKSSIFGSEKISEKVVSVKDTSLQIDNNFKFLKDIAKDMTSISESVKSLVEFKGGMPAVDANLDTTPQQVPEIEVQEGDKKKNKMPSAGMIMKVLGGVLVLGSLITAFWDDIVKAFKSFIEKLFPAIKEKFKEFVDTLGTFFTGIMNTAVTKFQEISKKIIDTTTNFFEQISGWIGGKIESIVGFFQPVMDFIGKLVDGFKSKLKAGVLKAIELDYGIGSKIRKFIPKPLLEFLGIPLTEEELGVKRNEQRGFEEETGLQKALRKADKARKDKRRKEQIRKAIEERTKRYAKRPPRSQAEKEFRDQQATFMGETPSIEELEAEGMSRLEAIAEHNRLAKEKAEYDEIILQQEFERVREKFDKKKEEKKLEKIRKQQATPLSENEKGVLTSATKVSSADKDIKAMIIKHEGVRYKPYKDSLGLWTVGVGHLIGDGKTLPDDMDRTFSADEIAQMFEKDYEHHKKIAEKTPGYQKANKAAKGAMIDLAFNMGYWWPKWPRTSNLLKRGDFAGAATELKDSKWYTQVGYRADTIVGLVASAGDQSKQGDSLNQTSNELASNQRKSSKPKTPNVNNVNNTNVINQNENSVQVAEKNKDSIAEMAQAA